MTPAAIAAAANALMLAHGEHACRLRRGDCLFTALDLLPTDLIAPGYYATMGYGVPAALGLQVATGRRPLVLVGDGAFQMTGWELGNARRLRCDPIVLLLNQRELGRCCAPSAARAGTRPRRLELRLDGLRHGEAPATGSRQWASCKRPCSGPRHGAGASS